MLISLAGVATLVSVSWLLGAVKSAPVDAQAALSRLAFEEPDFEPGEIIASADQSAAVVLSADGREAALALGVGDRIALRRVRVGERPVRAEGATLIVGTGDPARRALKVAASSPEEAERWRRLLAPAIRVPDAPP